MPGKEFSQSTVRKVEGDFVRGWVGTKTEVNKSATFYFTICGFRLQNEDGDGFSNSRLRSLI